MEETRYTVINGAPADLATMIEQAVKRAVREEVSDAVRLGMTKPYLTKKEVQTWTGWSKRKVDYIISKRSVPFVRRGRTVLFPTEEIIAYLEAGRVPKREKS